MAWVRSEYAGEFAVLSAWLSMVLPWNIVYATAPIDPLESKLAIVRLSIVEIQIRFPAVISVNGKRQSAAGAMKAMYPGFEIVRNVFVTSPVGSISHYDGSMQLASVAWAIGSLALLAAFAVSVALYLREDTVEAESPVDPVRLISGFLGIATLATAAASVLYFFDRNLGGIPIPVGVVVMGALSVALLRVERR